jgi:hypothetical protein
MKKPITYVVVANFILFAVLAVFFEGGAFPWGEINDGRFSVSSNIVVAQVSQFWFWFTFWQGLSAWAGAGIYAVINFASEAIKAEDEKRKADAAKHKSGIFIILVFLLLIFGNAIAIVYF